MCKTPSNKLTLQPTDEFFVARVECEVAQRRCRGADDAVRVETQQLVDDWKAFLLSDGGADVYSRLCNTHTDTDMSAFNNRYNMSVADTAEQGHCGACRRKWQLTDTDLCPCGETQTMSHIVESCPLTKLNGGLARLHSADEDAVPWLTNYGK